VTSDQWIGTTLAGYRIEAVIGRGGMGVVYRADHLSLGRKIALKVLAPAMAANDSFRRRFMHESRMAASIEHPNIIPIYEAGEVDDQLFLAMRYVEGPDLGRLLADGPLAPNRVVHILGQVADGLDAAHARGLVHRDVKPGNILVSAGLTPGAGEHVYLCDFGLVKPFETPSDLTFSGQFFGTVPYMAPEQIQGEQLDGRSDVYALGCVAYRCLTGQLPFPRESDMATVEAHMHEPPPRVTDLRPDLPPALDAIVARAMAKTKEERQPSCADLTVAMRAVLAGVETTHATRRMTTPLAPPQPAPEPATALAPPEAAYAPVPAGSADGYAPGYGPPAGPPGYEAGSAPAYEPAYEPAYGADAYGAGGGAGGPAAQRRSGAWWQRSPVAVIGAVFLAVAVLSYLGVTALRSASGNDRKPTATTVAAGIDTSQPGATEAGQKAASCVGGWTAPQTGEAKRTEPLNGMRAVLGKQGLFTLDPRDPMRYFRGGDGVERWYVKTVALQGDQSFAARWLVAKSQSGVAVTALAKPDTHGLKAPDWRSFAPGPQRSSYPGLPGTWTGSPVDFVATAGLPADVRGCLAGS
jgi:serine/threonine-protein kinase